MPTTGTNASKTYNLEDMDTRITAMDTRITAIEKKLGIT